MGESNWAGNVTYAAAEVLLPRTIEELQGFVAGASQVKALGSRHCFTGIADSPGGVQIDPAGIEVLVEIDAEAATVTVAGAARYGDFAETLHAAGFALPNLASLPHCTVAGSVATATHGSGSGLRGLASAVSAVELVTADGELRTYSRDRELPGLVVGLGAFGVVTRMTLDLVPAFDVRVDVFDGLPWKVAFEDFDAVMDSAYSVSMFTNWTGRSIDQVWLKTRLPGEAPRGFPGAVPADGPRHPAHAAGVSAENCTEQLGVPGPWYERIPHFKLAFTPSVGNEIQSEFFVPRRFAVQAMEAVRTLGPRLAPVLLVSEIRTVAEDELWLSPFHGGDRVALHFTWRPDQPGVEAVLPELEDRLAPFAARPHWGKLFHGAALDLRYPKLPEFRELAARLDPDGKFRNPFLRRYVFGE